MGIFKGLATTIKHVFESPVTVSYPEVERPVRERFKGRHALKRYDNGLEKCIGCALCAAACPADAIWVEASENTDEERYSPGERYAKTYEINTLLCSVKFTGELVESKDGVDSYDIIVKDVKQRFVHDKVNDKYNFLAVN